MKLEEIKNKTDEAVSYLVTALEAGQSDILTQYLNAMARFHNYSFGNIMLIARQKPQATNVAGIRTWNSLGRFVKRGEKGILILAPMIGRKKTDGGAESTADAKEATAQPYGFRAVYVFDVSQTEGKDPISHDPAFRNPAIETFHAKILLADRDKAYIGSANMTRWSRDFSMECGVILRGPSVKPVATLVEAMIKISEQQILNP